MSHRRPNPAKDHANHTSGVCRVCGCTDINGCPPKKGGPCSWADEAHTICDLCAAEEAALTRAGNAILHIVNSLDTEGLIPRLEAINSGTFTARAKLCAALVAAYLTGAGDQQALWKAWLEKFPGGGGNAMPRDIGADLREPGSGGPRFRVIP